jgi:hypothetical protein
MSKTAGPLDKLMPEQEHLRGAWSDCLRSAVGEPAILERFRAETGNTWMPGQSPFETMIDRATGADIGFFVAFAKWFNANVWGTV